MEVRRSVKTYPVLAPQDDNQDFECIEFTVGGNQAVLIPTDMFDEETTEIIASVVEKALVTAFTEYNA